MDTPLINGLLEYISQRNVPFHMPGHKNNANEFKELNIIQDNIFKMDLTEVEGVDNLHSPEGIIKDAQGNFLNVLSLRKALCL
ncbi:hypothetical protein PWK10_17250 [Caloramator sp. Dgby_cultured_2]|uniref:hypothetical protein n=1 Tax=Caloramator sp. Dgby_cultured_2 TaxID=3029174 RepID=UPI00237E7CFF|nr:hypothetical protein [Caloramator sp. Dgby_cultured_2]WDU83091.1 hypothetical protein PWK10_17250 [Caloramator sp. Dgby_cultured_2]